MFTTKLRIAAGVVMVLASLALIGMRSHRSITAAPVPEPRKVPKELLEKRRDAAHEVWAIRWEKIRRRANAQPSDLFGWSERLLEAELALLDNKEDRMKALLKHVERTREVEQIATSYVKVGIGTHSDAAAATYERIEAEIRYFQVVGKAAPPPPKPKEPLSPPVEETKQKK